VDLWKGARFKVAERPCIILESDKKTGVLTQRGGGKGESSAHMEAHIESILFRYAQGGFACRGKQKFIMTDKGGGGYKRGVYFLGERYYREELEMAQAEKRYLTNSGSPISGFIG